MIRLVGILLIVTCGSLKAQMFNVKSAHVSFFSDATIEDIAATNEKATSLINLTTGAVAFSIPVKEFVFDKALMQEHFNEKYLETEKFPKATFSGTISGLRSDASGVQQVTASGKLTIHGVSRDVSVPGTIEVKGSEVVVNAKFKVKLADHDIKIPKVLWQNIAEEVEVTVSFTYQPYEKN